MTAKEMQIRYWEKELQDAERAINLHQDGGEMLDVAQARYGNAEMMLERIRSREEQE